MAQVRGAGAGFGCRIHIVPGGAQGTDGLKGIFSSAKRRITSRRDG
jgi:hypothetical protein